MTIKAGLNVSCVFKLFIFHNETQYFPGETKRIKYFQNKEAGKVQPPDVPSISTPLEIVQLKEVIQ